MTGWDAGPRAVVTENGAQSGRRQRLPAVWTFGHYEDLLRIGLRTFREQIGPDQTGNLRVQGNASLLVALANNAHPSAWNIHVANLQAQDFGRTQTAQEH